MKVLAAGAGGALGRQLVPRLVAAGHEVVGMTRSPGKRDAITALGANTVIADALECDQVAHAVAEAEPEAIVHELKALSGSLDMRHFDRDFESTNRLRTDATNHLLLAGRAVGVHRFVAQSYAGWPFARVGGPVKTEEDPLDPTPVESMRRTLEAIGRLEEAVTGAEWTEGIALRYGGSYGPGTAMAPGGEHFEMIRRRFPIVGDGAGVWSFVQIEDAAEATVAALARGHRGVYKVVDDEPAPVAEWLPALALELGAKPPRRVPRWLGRLLAGEAAAVMMTEVRGASNAKAKRDLDWRPAHPSWRRGWWGRRDRPPRAAAGLPRAAAGRVAPGRIRCRLRDARQRRRGRGRGAGGAAAAERGAGAGRADLLARAYLATVTTRLAIDELRSARARRETYVGDWLPEPLLTAEAAEDPARQTEMADSLAFAFLVLLESLTPEERAMLLLHDVFDYGYREVADVVGKSEDNARQLAVRARRRIEQGRPRFEGTREKQEELGSRFFDAAERGDLEALEALLARDVVLRGDGGGRVPALARSIGGAGRGVTVRRAGINGRPGALLLAPDGGLVGAMVPQIDADRVIGVNSVVNPDKLRHLGPVSDLGSVLRQGDP